MGQQAGIQCLSKGETTCAQASSLVSAASATDEEVHGLPACHLDKDELYKDCCHIEREAAIEIRIQCKRRHGHPLYSPVGAGENPGFDYPFLGGAPTMMRVLAPPDSAVGQGLSGRDSPSAASPVRLKRQHMQVAKQPRSHAAGVTEPDGTVHGDPVKANTGEGVPVTQAMVAAHPVSKSSSSSSQCVSSEFVVDGDGGALTPPRSLIGCTGQEGARLARGATASSARSPLPKLQTATQHHNSVLVKGRALHGDLADDIAPEETPEREVAHSCGDQDSPPLAASGAADFVLKDWCADLPPDLTPRVNDVILPNLPAQPDKRKAQAVVKKEADGEEAEVCTFE